MLAGTAVASDAFFPFADACLPRPMLVLLRSFSLEARCATTEVIAAADERGLAMVFTGVRHFRH